jgi:hypothetical protein
MIYRRKILDFKNGKSKEIFINCKLILANDKFVELRMKDK